MVSEGNAPNQMNLDLVSGPGGCAETLKVATEAVKLVINHRYSPPWCGPH